MSTVEQIEAAIQQLPREDFFRLHEWVKDRFEDEWDKQFEEDAKSGHLDRVTQEATAEYRAGKSTSFPPNEKKSPSQFWGRLQPTSRESSATGPQTIQALAQKS